MEYTLSTGEAAALLGKAVKTLQRWDREGVLIAHRTKTGRRLYSEQQLREFVGLKPPMTTRTAVAYCRVSSQAQKPDLKKQRKVVEDFCVARGLANVEFVVEIGGGLNFKRKEFVRLVDRIISGEVSHVILAHRDRLVRFGFDLIVHLCQKHACELLVIDVERLSPEVEMVQDLMSIVHCFSSRLYGLRNYRKSLREACASAANP